MKRTIIFLSVILISSITFFLFQRYSASQVEKKEIDMTRTLEGRESFDATFLNKTESVLSKREEKLTNLSLKPRDVSKVEKCVYEAVRDYYGLKPNDTLFFGQGMLIYTTPTIYVAINEDSWWDSKMVSTLKSRMQGDHPSIVKFFKNSQLNLQSNRLISAYMQESGYQKLGIYEREEVDGKSIFTIETRKYDTNMNTTDEQTYLNIMKLLSLYYKKESIQLIDIEHERVFDYRNQIISKNNDMSAFSDVKKLRTKSGFVFIVNKINMKMYEKIWGEDKEIVGSDSLYIGESYTGIRVPNDLKSNLVEFAEAFY